MKLVENFLKKNPCYKANRKIVPQGVMLHSIGCPQPSAKVLMNNWNRESYARECPHAFVDANDGVVYQTLPWNHRGWHSGGSANSSYIGIEMCEPSKIKYIKDGEFKVLDQKVCESAVERTYRSAVEIVAQLCVQHNFDPMTQVLSHSEAGKKGIASHGADPENVWSGLRMPYTMNTFRADVLEEMKAINRTEPEAEVETKTEPEVAEAEPALIEQLQVTEIKIQIPMNNLRIRTGPGTDNSTTGQYTGAGVFSVTEIQNGTGSNSGWGKLSDGRGWICMDHVQIME